MHSIPIGSQLYPHRQRVIDGDFAGLCKDMSAIGIGNVELCCPNYAEFANLSDAKQVKKILDDNGLQCTSSHFALNGLRTQQSKMIDWAKEIGMKYMATASLADVHGRTTQTHNGLNTMDGVKKAADEYNEMGARAAEAGLQQTLHDEDYEMAKIEGDGRMTYTVLLELLDPELVKMQFQMSAMRVIGDPIAYFNQYPGRFISMHCQGVNFDAPIVQPYGGGQDFSVAVGKDSLDWPKIFEVAKANGLKDYFVEQPWDVTVQSVEYLKTLTI